MPVGTQGAVKGVDAPRSRGDRRADSAQQHLPPVSAPRRRSDRAARRPAPLHRLDEADPDRQRRLPGVQPGRAADDRRGRRALQVAPRRLVASADAGEGDGHPGAARIGHRDGARRVPRATRPRSTRRARRWSGRCAGRRARAQRLLALRDRTGRRRHRDQPRPGAVRHRPGRRVSAICARRARARRSRSASRRTPSAG